jgi:hypothetical protein
LWSQPSRSMCSRWNMCSKWVVKFSMFFPQTSRGKRHLLQIISMSGTIIRRLWMHHLRRGLWGDFPSLYSRFYKVIMHGSTNATNEGRIQM